MPPKSILKNASQPPSKSHADRNLELALHHARLIQQRKDIEALILTATETLLDFPSSSTTDPAEPSGEDESRALILLQPFQLSDFDSLIEERNIDGKCGYVLCPRPHRKEGTNAKYRILRGNKGLAQDMKIVERVELEKWCSDECGKRALYLRVQLSDTPAWERTSDIEGKSTLKILKGDSPLDEHDRGTNVDIVTRQLKQLAMERGVVDENVLSSLLKATVIESHQAPQSPSQTPVLDHDVGQGHGSIEGYVARLNGSRLRTANLAEDGNDVMDTI